VVPISVANGTVTPGTAQAVQETSTLGLDGVACPTATTCVAVGTLNGDVGAVLPISVTNGTVTPDTDQVVLVGSDEETELGGVACPTAATCVAVGTGSNPDYGFTQYGVMLSISVTSGTVTPGDVQDDQGTSDLSGVACPSSTSCVAVGEDPYEFGPFPDVTLTISVTDGTVTPGTAQTGFGASDVTCPTATTCVAVNYTSPGESLTSYAEINLTNGTPTPGGVQLLPGTDELSGVACPTTATCVAVGSLTTSPSEGLTMAFTLPMSNTPAVSTTSLPLATFGAPYSAALTAIGGVSPYAWSISQGSLPVGLSLNSATGVISGTPTAVGTSSFTVQLADAESPPASATAQLAITVGSPPQITSASPARFTVGRAGTFTVTAGGFPAPSLTLDDAAWFAAQRTGLTFTDNGNGTATISGTPAAGTAGMQYDLTITAQNGVSPAVVQDLTLTVNSMPSPPVVSTTSLPGATLNTSYSATFAATGGMRPYSWSLKQGSLPAGLSLNSATGVISGTPTAVGTSSFTVQLADAESPPSAATAQLSITVGPAPHGRGGRG
jgi:hypothetical protein